MANIHGLHSNRRDSGSDNDDNEDGNNRYVGGVDSRGGGSGLAVMPNTEDGDDASSSIFRQAGEATADDGPIRRTITMYRDGFTVDNGPYRRLDDPNNSEFLSSLARGITPRELSEGGENVTVGLVDKRGEDYDPDAAAAAGGGGGFQSFTGTGNSLGTASTSASSGSSSGDGIFVPDASATAPTLTSNPSTSIQVRLLNGKRLVLKVNLDATVSSLGEHIDASGDGGGEPYVLSSGFPPRTITDLGQSIEGAGLKGAQVMQKKA